ncbi:helix-turn-helix domain-containing protein [Carnobacterium maltaromaticum]|nr:helix-turn-helix domain-containing protein [Carnobacterium maltaromaticum]
MYYKQNDDQSYTVIFDGSKEELKAFIKDYQQFSQSLLGDFLIGVGETVNEIVEVASSYEHALHALQIRNFYQIKGLELTKQIETGMIPQLSFTKFNQALYIRDFDTIREEVDMMLEKLRKHGALPEYSRQMIFLIFMDLYRQFENLDESFYQVNFEKIATAQSFEGLESVIEETLLEIKHVKKERSYSQNTQHMLEIITKRYSEDLSLKVVADELFLNVMYLGQIFKKETQKSFSQYLNQYRIKKAQNLLVQSDGNINEIAIAVGYTSAGYFYKNFKKICGISPKEFRERFENSYDPIDS